MNKMKELSVLDKEIIQANPLIRARKRMNLTEMRLFALGLQDIHPHIRDDKFHDVEFHETFISYGDLITLFDDKNNGNIANLKNHIEKAYDAKIELSREDGGFGFRHIYKKIDYIPYKGLVIQFDDEIKPYILEVMNQRYTKYKIKAFFALSSPYAWRLLECLLEMQGYLRQGKPMIYIELSIEEIRFRFNVPDNAYKGRIDNFKRKVIDEPIKKINDATDYFVWYDTLKKGRKIIGYRFWLKMKQTTTNEQAEQQPPQITSSQVVATGKETEKNDMEDPYKGLSMENFFALPELIFEDEDTEEPVPAGDDEVDAEQPPQKEEPAPTPAVAEVEEKSDDREGEKWTAEQQADFDTLIKYEIWKPVAKKYVNELSHERIKRNIDGVLKSKPKGNIRDISAVLVNAIDNDTYQGLAEEQAKAREREQANKQAEWETRQKIQRDKEEKNRKDSVKLAELTEIRKKKSKEELIAVLDDVLAEYKQNNDMLTDEMVKRLESYGIPQSHFSLYRYESTRKSIKYI